MPEDCKSLLLDRISAGTEYKLYLKAVFQSGQEKSSREVRFISPDYGIQFIFQFI